MRQVYLDYASAKPLDPRVAELAHRYEIEEFGNPASQHRFGYPARSAVNEARDKVGTLIAARKAEEIVFTSGATESNNLAIVGTARRLASKGRHVITTAIEHMSVLNPCKALAKEGFEITFLPVDSEGKISPRGVEKALRPDTILITIGYANGEVGTIQPIAAIGEIAKAKAIVFHSDATAALGQIAVDVVSDNLDLLTISSNDLYGPRGSGALYVRQGVRLNPVLYGGGQERGIRSGSLSVPSLVAFGEAARLTKVEGPAESKRLLALRNRLISGVLETIERCYLNGPREGRLPNNVSIRFDFVEGEAILLSLGLSGIYAASGSACTSLTLEPSHVLLALGVSHADAQGSILFSLGKTTSEDDINYSLEQIPPILSRLRAMSPLAV